jgi:zinc carboxypeptidase
MITKFLKYFIISFLIQGVLVAQDKLSQKLYETYSNYKISEVENKRFSHSDLMNILGNYEDSDLIEISTAGYSVEGREIKLIKIGSGKINIMAWSQMHGDESTATMALLDFLNFVETKDEFSEFKSELFKKITLYIIPMLNPDGTEKFSRRNELDIDLNRDALRLQFPESKVLKKIQEETKPLFSFNLHDQSTRYTVGNSYKVAAISFLAPAFNYEKDINDVRENAMKLISQLTNNLHEYIPGHIAKYSDDFEPRAFGDNFVKWGSSLVLIESGGWKNNYEKNFLRKLNFVALISGFESIANESYTNESIDTYKNIPENQKRLFDLLLRNVTIEKNKQEFIVDLGINQNETGTSDRRGFYFVGEIEDVGDLSTFYGFDEIDCSGMKIDTAETYTKTFNNLSDLAKIDVLEILKEGYSFVQVDSIETSEKFVKHPINIVKSGTIVKNKIGVNKKANFVIKENGHTILVCVNGFLFDIRSEKNYIQNGLIYK